MTCARWRHALAIVAVASSCAVAQSPPSTPGAETIKRGEYLAIAGDCVACHTTPGGKPFAGGVVLPTPMGDIVATNITPSTTAGIGNYTQQQFADALRKGIAGDGSHLYPAMPYTSYAKISDDDIAALYAYFMHGVEPVDVRIAPTHLPFPFNMRWLMAFWNAMFLDERPFAPVAGQSAEWNHGAYLVEALEHCSVCHSPRNLLFAESSSKRLAGGKVGPWDAPNITSDPNSGIGAWSDDELIAYLKHGDVPGKAQAGGSMAEAIDASLRHLTGADLRAIVAYVKTVPALHEVADTRPRFDWGAPSNDLATIRAVAWPANPAQLTGPQLYDAWCATCHQDNAQGSLDREMPSLYHNTALGNPESNNLVLVMLDGIHRRGDTVLPMPGFAQDMTDHQLATLGAWLVVRYGNPAAKVTEAQVANLRQGGGPSYLVPVVQALIGIGAAVVIAIIVLGVRRRRHQARSTHDRE
jgi:mono/diheme cytochrome c family protein